MAKKITVTVGVDVSLSEISTEDLIEEIVSRPGGRLELEEYVIENYDIDMPELKNLDEQYKFKHLMEVFEKYSLVQIQAALPV